MTFAQPFRDYEILARVGAGAMGTVFKARQRKLDRVVALKVLKPSLARDTRYVDRLRREARIVAALNHPNIVAGYDLGEEGGYHFFVMEFVEGRSLKDLLKEWGMFPEEQVLTVGVQIASALDHAWQKGVIHRDIKPGNVLIDAAGMVKLTDMGLAKGPADLTITRDGATVGTPQYIAPEQARNPQEADVRSDLYSLGATLYHMATGAPPFAGETLAQVLTQVLHDRPVPPRQLNPKLSEGLDLVLRKLLAKDPALRYQTPAELLQDLKAVQRAERPAVDERSLERELAAGARRSRWWPAALVLAGGLLAGAIWLAVRGDGEDPALRAAAREEWARTAALEELRSLAGPVARLAFLARRERETSDPELRRVYRSLADGVRAAGQTELDDVLAECWRGAPQWFRAPRRWLDREGARYFTEFVPQSVEARLHCAPADLPEPLRTTYEGWLLRQREAARALLDRRDQELLSDLDAHLAADPATRWRVPLAAGDFALARAQLDQQVQAFFAAPGRPALGEVEGTLAERITERTRQYLEQARAVIAQEERRAAEFLQHEAEESLAALVRLRDSGADHELVRASLESLRQELRASHPGPQSFAAEVDPWPRLEGELRALERELRDARVMHERQRLAESLRRAHLLMSGAGDASDEVAWIAQLRVQEPEVEALRARQIEWLGAAGSVLREAAEHLLAGRAARLWILPRGETQPSRPAAIEVVRSGERGFGFRAQRRDGPAEPMAVRDLPWRELLDEVRGGGAAAEGGRALLRARGFAYWLFAQGNRAAAAELVDPADVGFLANEVGPLLPATVTAPDDPALVAMRRLQDGYAARDLERVREALSELRDRHAASAVVRDNQRTLADVVAWAGQEGKAREVRAQIAARVPQGTGIEYSEARGLVLSYGPGRGLDAALPAGWRRQDDELASPAAACSLAEALRGAIAVPAPVRDEDPSSLVVELRFTEPPADVRLVVLSLQGISAAVAVLRGEGVVATALATDGVERGDTLRRALQRPLEEALTRTRAHIVPGARHGLELRLKPNPERREVQVRILLDGVEVHEDVLPRPGHRPQLASLASLEPVSASSVRVVGKP